jgi:hypothetical protein
VHALHQRKSTSCHEVKLHCSSIGMASPQLQVAAAEPLAHPHASTMLAYACMHAQLACSTCACNPLQLPAQCHTHTPAHPAGSQHAKHGHMAVYTGPAAASLSSTSTSTAATTTTSTSGNRKYYLLLLRLLPSLPPPPPPVLLPSTACLLRAHSTPRCSMAGVVTTSCMPSTHRKCRGFICSCY